MPRTRSLAWAELKIGLVSVFALLMAILLVFTLSGEGGFFWDRYAVKATFSSVAGLKAGAPVRLAGVEVGSVTGLAFVGDRVDVVMAVNRAHQRRITSNSVASLGSVSLLGEAAIDITASSDGAPVPEWGYIRSGRPVGTIGDVATQAGAGLEELTAVVAGLRAGRGTLGRLLADDSLYRELGDLVAAAEAVARSINDGRGTLGRLATSPAAAEALERSLANLDAVTARIRAGEGSLGRLLADEALSTSLTSAGANLDAITGRISRGEGTAGKLVTEEELYERLNSMANRLDNVMAALERGQGTAGQLLQDRQLYENMNGAIGEIRKLVSDIRADPRKYLTVRVTLF
jgi:phospholipid/cholesterol/gamma-HCH transport system substrate-binding protein